MAGHNKGRQLKVQPIRELDKIKAIKRYTPACIRDHLLFVLGINNGLRVSDLVVLQVWQVWQVWGRKTGEHFSITEQKTGKENVLVINKAVEKALKLYWAAYPGLEDTDYVFLSQR